ncbi:MAG: CBS domain-containing protein, partial [Nitrososphaerales archaeon]
MDINSTSIMKVFDVMSTDVVTTGITGSLSEATKRMLEREVGCIVVTNKEAVVGMITKGDILKKAFLKGVV